MESYFNCCGRCVYLNLYARSGARFYCEERKFYCLADEEKCCHFEPDQKKTYRDIQRACEGKY